MQLLHSDNTINLETTEQQAGPAILTVHLQQRMTCPVSHPGYSMTNWDHAAFQQCMAITELLWSVLHHTDAKTIFCLSLYIHFR